MPQFAVVAIDASDLEEGDRKFLEAWANNLNVSVDQLAKNILLQAVKGGHYVEGLPDESDSES